MFRPDVVATHFHKAFRLEESKPAIFIASSKRDLCAFPIESRRLMGAAIFDAQEGGEHPAAKALKGFGGRNVLEIIDDLDGNTYRAVYTVRFASAVYVLHAFQKKAKKGVATPQHDVELIKTRLKFAERHYRQMLEQETP